MDKNEIKKALYKEKPKAVRISEKLSDDIKRTEYPYPDELLDEGGYPTEEALEYINNWTIQFKDKEVITGKYWGKVEYEKVLIDYITSIWNWFDSSQLTEHSLQLHTVGWSGNEEIIPYLQKTWFWSNRFFMTISGGHYYFTLSEEGRKEIINSLKE